MAISRGFNAPKLFSIGQVHAITGIPKPTIRYWEKEFKDYLEPKRTTGNQRRYDEKAIADLEKDQLFGQSSRLYDRRRSQKT